MLESMTVWKAGELVILGVLGWVGFIIKTQDKKSADQDAVITAQAARMTSLEDKIYEMQTKFVTEEQMNSKYESMQEDMREMKSDIKTLLARGMR